MEENNKNVAEAMKILKQTMINDGPSERGSYAHGWHCNIACMCMDAMDNAGPDLLTHADRHRISNDVASRFMKLCFDVETKA